MADWHASPDGAACRTGRGAGPWSTTEKVKRGMGQLTWRSAAREVGRAALRHKVLSAIIAVCVAGSLTAIGVIGSASGQPMRPAEAPAPAFSLPLLGNDSGQQITLSKYRGQPLIVNFFASWCGPCKTETPLLASFYRGEKMETGRRQSDTPNPVPPANSEQFSDESVMGVHPPGLVGPLSSDNLNSTPAHHSPQGSHCVSCEKGAVRPRALAGSGAFRRRPWRRTADDRDR